MIVTKLKQAKDLRTPATIIVPNVTNQQGRTIKDYDNPKERFNIFCNFKTYGGSEVKNNNIYVVLDTAEIFTWYDPRITSDTRLELDNGAIYDVVGEPENIDRANVFCKFKVQRVKGGA